jgi:molecular chaperone DnaK
VPKIEVRFDIDANGILNVHAKDLGTGKEQKITITSSSGLSKDEVEKAVREADSNRSNDSKRREAVEAKNQLDTLVYSTEKLLEENGDKIGASEKSSIESAVTDAKKVLESKSGDAEALKKAAADLQKASYKIAEVLYKSAAATEAPGGPEPKPSAGPTPTAKTDDVIDAEVVEERK